MRLIFSVLLLLPFCQNVFAADIIVVPPLHSGRPQLYLPDTEMPFLFTCSKDKTQVNWSLESADRKLMSGIAKVFQNVGGENGVGVGEVKFKTPPLKDGITLKLKLTIDGKTEPFFLVSPDVFADQENWLKSLNLILVDGDDRWAASTFTREGIPYKSTVEETTRNALILVTNKKFSADYFVWALQGNNVVVIAPEEGELELSQMYPPLNETFLITARADALFKSKAIKKDDDLTKAIFNDINMYNKGKGEKRLMIGVKDEKVVLQTIPENSETSPNSCWHYADFQCGRGRLLFITTPIFEHWTFPPVNRLFLKMLFEELEIKETKN